MKNLSIFSLLFLTFLGIELKAQNVNIEFRSQLTTPGQTLANICGYAAGGREYALLGAAEGMIVVDVTDPDNPVQIVQIPMVDNLWKEIKVYQHYAYVTSEGSQSGLQIIDLSNLPAADLPYVTYTGDGAIEGTLSTIHALHIDVTKGFVYLYGSNLVGGGVLVLDLNADPMNPTYVGSYDTHYVHDGYVDNDTLYAGEIFEGQVRIMDFTDKTAPAIIADVTTPGNFTHNTWLTPDKNHMLTTDEVGNSVLACYNISNLADIQEVDRIQSNPGSNSVVHNTHILADYYAVTSWYNDGVTIVDCSRPHNLIQVGNYDTAPLTGDGFEGAWGVYPYLPTGTLVVSNIDEGLFVLSPTYKRGCYFEGTVVDSVTNLPIFGAKVQIIGGDINANDLSATDGAFACGQVQNGVFDVLVTRIGYYDYTTTISLENGVLTQLLVKMKPTEVLYISGNVQYTQGGSVPNVLVHLYNPDQETELTTDENGFFNLTPAYEGDFYVYAAEWLYGQGVDSFSMPETPSPIVTLNYNPGDWFETDLGWTSGGTADAGLWVRAAPLGTYIQNSTSNPETDVDSDWGAKCYVTGNDNASVGADDVDNGHVWLKSPSINIPITQGASYLNVNLSYWFFNGGGNGTINDTMRIYALGDNGDGVANSCDSLLLTTITGNSEGWQPFSININFDSLSFFGTCAQGDTWYVHHIFVQAEDYAPGHLVEAGIDKVEFSQIIFVADNTPTTAAQLQVQPNPFTNQTLVKYDLAQASTLRLTDVSGRELQSWSLAAGQGSLSLGAQLAAGVYFLHMPGGQAQRIIKM